MKPKKEKWLDTYISDDFVHGVMIGWGVVVAAVMVIMAVYKWVD